MLHDRLEVFVDIINDKKFKELTIWFYVSGHYLKIMIHHTSI